MVFSNLALAVGASAGLAAGLGAYLLQRLRATPAPSIPAGADPPGEGIAILCVGGRVIDATADAQAMLGSAALRGAPWQALRDILAERFGTLPEDPPDEPLTLESGDGEGAVLRILPESGPDATTRRLRLTIDAPALSLGLQQRLVQERHDLDRIEAVMRAIPNPIWQTDETGNLLWSNAAFDRLCQSAERPTGAVPFELAPNPALPVQRERVSLKTAGGDQRWFEVTTERRGLGTLHFASSIDSLVAAEMAQRNFVQTLTKTFAHLPIGLAVFDRTRQLVLFNPALVDLTRLPVDFLSLRPNLMSFFDHMRENRMMPEPKNYASWRDQLAEVVSAARDDRYCETWTLPSGLTYKITGRPHPDGAVAFLIEDISAEISLTRRFRSELELTQSVIDCFEDAVAVFSQLGVLTFSNAAFRSLWDCDPDSAFAEMTIMDATQTWQRACEPSPIWPELRDFVLTYRDRAGWDSRLKLKDGRSLNCWVEPVAAGATMVRFAVAPSLRGRAPAPVSAAG